MVLVVDIGNTNIVIGVFNADELKLKFRMATDRLRTPEEYGFFIKSQFSEAGLTADSVKHAIVSSVVPQLDFTFKTLIRNLWRIDPLFVSHSMKLNIRFDYDSPSEIGADRIVNAAAAYHLWPTDLVVLDFGTATTVEFVDRGGVYKGGVILPGFNLMKDSLHLRTAKLPDVEVKKPEAILGRNTIQSIQSGLYYVSVGGLRYIIDRVRSEYAAQAKIVATGGLSALLRDDLSLVDQIEPDLTLTGLNFLFHLNNVQS